ncbi:Hypothetical predicted protein [Scomber scombrus]|uniref:Uncharacterized protein n=1 Tax=Scomber scombrus TaxID=13677 RepID=A0AAV1PJI9_SCOSC
MCAELRVNGRQAVAVWRGRDRQLCLSTPKPSLLFLDVKPIKGSGVSTSARFGSPGRPFQKLSGSSSNDVDLTMVMMCWVSLAGRRSSSD